MKLISKLKKLFPIISIIVLIVFWGKKPSIYKGMLDGIPTIELCILFILFCISFILQARVIYKTYKRENGKLPIKELLFPITIVVISIIIILNILKSGMDINNVYKLKSVCEEKIADFTYNLTVDGYSKRLNIEYEDFIIDSERGTYDINYRIKDSGVITFNFDKEENKLIGAQMIIPSTSEEEYRSPISLQSALLTTFDKKVFKKEYTNSLITQMLVKISEQGDEDYKKGCSFEKEDYEINCSYFLDMWWTFSIYID